GVVALAAVVLTVAGMARSRDGSPVLLLFAAGLGAVGYLLMPAGAWVTDGQPDLMLFTANLRYLLPALALLPILAGWCAATSRPRVAIATGGLLAAAGMANVARSIGFDPPPGYTRAAVLAIGGAIVAVALVRRWPKLVPIAGL